MSSKTIVQVNCEPYLIRFLETLYGPQPISFPRKSNFNAILDVFLDKPPFNYSEPDYGEHSLKILLPYFENKDIRSYNYLSPKKQVTFTKEIWKYFKISYRNEIAKYIVLGLDRKDAIELFIEKYNLSQDNWDLLEKDFQRYLNLRAYHKLFRNNKSSSVKGTNCPAPL